MTRFIELPEAWVVTMERVRSVLPSAYLAGGAIRDFDNQRPVKDLDVFFTEAAWPLTWLEDQLAKLGYFYKSQCPGQYLDGAANEVYGTTVYQNTEGQPELNLIQLEPGFNSASIIERVDFGLCQIGADMLGVEYTPAYEYDRTNHVLTLTRAESVDGVWRSLMRYERLSQKYQGWALNVPEEFKALVEAAEDAHNAGTLASLGIR
jgi:hypothetical protein